MRRLACCFAMLLSTALLGSGCKSEDPKPKTVVPTGVALFLNGTYVDYSSTAPLSWHEARNVEEHLVDTGLPLTTFTGISSAEINAAVAGVRRGEALRNVIVF